MCCRRNFVPRALPLRYVHSTLSASVWFLRFSRAKLFNSLYVSPAAVLYIVYMIPTPTLSVRGLCLCLSYSSGRFPSLTGRAGVGLLHRKYIESAVNHSYGAGYEFRGIRHQVVDGAAELLRLTHAAERCLAHHVLAALSV